MVKKKTLLVAPIWDSCHQVSEARRKDTLVVSDFLDFLEGNLIQLLTWTTTYWDETCSEAGYPQCDGGKIRKWDRKFGDTFTAHERCNGSGKITRSKEDYAHISDSYDRLIARFIGIDYDDYQAEKEMTYRYVTWESRRRENLNRSDSVAIAEEQPESSERGSRSDEGSERGIESATEKSPVSPARKKAKSPRTNKPKGNN